MTSLLAGGWKQRLALGCAILHEPPILFLDEPTSGVDPIARRSFWELIYQLSGAGHTIFVSTHYMDEAEYCHRIALMYRGKVIALGTPAELKESLSSHHIVDLETEDVLGAMTAIEGVPGVLESAVFGAGLHVNVDRVETAIPAIRERLAAEGIAVHRLEQIPPSMEDVFVAMIEQEDRRNAMNWRRTRAIARKEFLHIIRDVRSLILALLLPFVMLMLFGYALSLDVDKIPTIVYDRDRTPESRELIRQFSGTPYFAITGYAERPSDIDHEIDRSRVLLGLVIPRGLREGSSRRA